MSGDNIMNRLQGKVALITGGASGLGAQIGRRFTEEGATVIVNDLLATDAEKMAAELGGDSMGVGFDVSDSAAVEAGFKAVAERFSRLDILVNNAGIGLDMPEEERLEREQKTFQQIAEAQAGGPIETFVDVTMNMPDDRWRRMLAIHLDGTFYCTREALKIMSPQMSGSIISMGSIMGTAGGGGSPHYCAAKAGIMGFTRSLARELVPRGIRVNALAPGFIDTPMTAPMGETKALIEAITPMGRFGVPDDIAWAAVYLASDEANFMTGQVISPNGGYHMSQ
ncbi:MAG: 3-oxoacyl-[acyl-carrier protein] reductase [Acidimicrobiales bacterium]|jgi:3-oxoacyl-[acyl-carrier protein] reductase